MPKYFKHTYHVVILSESPDADKFDDLPYNVSHGPDCLHTFALAKTEFLNGKQMAGELRDAGSDSAFFQLDDDGNKIE